MNRMLSNFILLFMVLLIFLACNRKSKTVKDQFLIGFSQCNSAEPWREAMNREMKNEAAKHSKIKLIISDGMQDNSKQYADVENFLMQEVDLLIISPNEAKPLTSIVEKTYNSGIPVIVLDRKIMSDAYTTYIGADNVLIGEMAGKYAAKVLEAKGKIVEIWGLKGSTPAIERHKGFVKVLNNYPNIKIIYEQDGAWLRRRGREIMENALQRFENIDLVYGHNDPMAIGAYLAAKNVNREEDIYFIGIDGLPGPEGGIKAVEDKKLDATFLYPTGGKEAIEIALKILSGENVRKNITLDTKTVTLDTSDGNSIKY